MDFMGTIEKPWQHPISYLELVLWFIVFIIVAFAVFDGLRILASWMKSAAVAA
jgi:hypothetical protein